LKTLEAALAQAVESAVRAALGNAWRLRAARRIGGGSIADSWRIETNAQPLFLKIGAATHPFDAEAQALEEIAATHTLRVPRPITRGAAGASGFLVLEWIDLHEAGDWAAANG
jgi:fructosamine-3-kinase